MSLVVTGIAQTADTKALETALRAADLSLERLSVVSGGSASTEGVADSGVRFVYAGDSSTSSLINSGGGIMTSTDGTNVPGLSRGGNQEYFRQETLGDLLSDLEIPDSSLDNYVEAVEAGRSVMVYYAHPDTVARVEEIFRTLDLKNVKVY